jgi:CRISPR system Cascade subunit CasD
MDALILRLDAPLMSFGGVMVDHHNVTDRFPGLSLFAGLLANAQGWSHGDGEKIGALQDRLIVATRWDIEPEAIVDYHTVDLGQPKMVNAGWTTRGVPEHRDGGEAKKGTHIRLRHYLANGVLTAILALTDDTAPDLATLENALIRPMRPLFLGRKTCLPSAPIFLGRATGDDVLAILKSIPRTQCVARKTRSQTMAARWPADVGTNREDQLKAIYDQRDWKNQWHAGRRIVAEGPIEEMAPCS